MLPPVPVTTQTLYDSLSGTLARPQQSRCGFLLGGRDTHLVGEL